MPAVVSPLKSVWNEKLRSSLHIPANWTNSGDCKLVHVPTDVGFYGPEQMKQFCSQNGPCNIFNEEIQSVSCLVDEATGRIVDEFVAEWTQSITKMGWMLPGLEFPLRKYRLSFVISAEIDPIKKLLQSVRVYWDHSSLLKQIGVIPLPSGEESKSKYRGLLENYFPLVGGLSNLTSILDDLPRSTSGPAVMTPQRPASSRSLNPALLGTFKFSDDKLFDSPLPANTRNVKSRNIFFEDSDEVQKTQTPPQIGLFEKMAKNESYRPGLASNSGASHNCTSHVFTKTGDDDKKYLPTMNLNETFSHQYESDIFSCDPAKMKKWTGSNLPQTDKILFESHVFDSTSDQPGLQQLKENHHVATAPPQCQSQILSPEEDLKCKRDDVSATLSRPSMLGHFRGSSLGETLNTAEGSEDKDKKFNNFIPSTAIRFDPNKSQIVLGEYFPEDDKESAPKRNGFVPSSRVFAPPGGQSTIFNNF